MRQFVRGAAVFILILSATDCASVKMRTSRTAAPAAVSTREYKIHSYLFGIVTGEPPRDIARLCDGSKVGDVNLKMKSVDVALSIVTLGIYFPQTVQITCNNF
jgi:hypothetical protein